MTLEIPMLRMMTAVNFATYQLTTGDCMKRVQKYINFRKQKNDFVCQALLNVMTIEELQRTYQYFAGVYNVE